MPKVTYFAASSLDGFIGDQNNSLEWLAAVDRGDDTTAWDRLMSETDALVIGATTYRWMIQ